MNRRIIISEEEKRKIRSLYSVNTHINEQNEDGGTQPVKPVNITVPVYFESGCYSNKGGESCAAGQVDKVFEPYLQQIKDFVIKNKDVKSEVVLSASESKVPNRDAEKPKIYIKKSGKYVHPRLQPSVLSQKRYLTIENYLKNIFNKMIAEGQITALPEFTKSDVLIGGPEWTVNDSASDPKFKEHQYLKAEIRLKALTPESLTECITGLQIGYDYDEVVLNHLYKINGPNGGHYCDFGRFQISANDISLKRSDGKEYASVNNKNYSEIEDVPGKTQKTENGYTNWRYNTFSIDNTLGQEIITKNPTGNIVIKSVGLVGPLGNNWGGDLKSPVHIDAARITIKDMNGGILYDSCAGGNCVGKSEGQWTVTPEQYCVTKKVGETATQ